jgi:adenosylhomocysteinase
MYDIKDISLYKEGRLKIEWAKTQMPVISYIKEKFKNEKPLKGIKISACLHVTSETANLLLALKEGGADIALCASNPLSTQDEVASALVKYGISVFAKRGESKNEYYNHIHSALEIEPHITMDDGADLVTTVHTKQKRLIKNIIAGTEETTTGVIRLKNMANKNVLQYPIIAVNDANTKHLFDNRYGTGQSTIDGILRATNILIAGLNVVVCGYGWCGRGVAMRARGMGANVIICEIDPVKALEAVMDGFKVMPLKEAAKIGHIFITVTGNTKVITKEHFKSMRNGAILANSGHFNVEIDIPALENLAKNKRRIRNLIDEYTLENNKKIYLLAEGRLVNLSAAEGHPACVMDMSFANQALSVLYLVRNGNKLEKKVYPVPKEIDNEVAILKLKSMGINIDKLTKEQKKYISSWEIGT